MKEGVPQTQSPSKSGRLIRSQPVNVRIGFQKNSGVAVAIGSANRVRLANIDGVKDSLLTAASTGVLRKGQSVILEMQVADSGLVVSSRGGSGEMTATTNFDVGETGAPKLLNFAADFNVKSSTAAMDHATFPNGFIPSFRVVTLGERGWWFWRHVVLVGFAGPGLDDPELTLDRDDYFAPYPDAEFPERVTIDT